ncbi:Hypothetical protein GLP15_4600 [Giardia lamblia P15]|uniref:Uncharacterized protein n=1 Tax=Giardia intestinalis (strain P15) TaxID=658858 RepID=E1F7Q0_GIAIA|nr:Hypothetical protein GLP15_4600 [Giardia lamblia P15]
MQNTVKVKVQLLKTLDDGSVDPNCYACKMGHVILTSDGRISSESPAVKDKRLLIKKNGKVDNRSAICKKTVDQDKTIQASLAQTSLASSLSMTQPNTILTTRDSTETTTPSVQQGSTLSITSECKSIVHATVSSVPSAPSIPSVQPISTAPLSMPNTMVQPPVPTQKPQLSSLAPLPLPPPVPAVRQSPQLQTLVTTHRNPQFPSANHQEKAPVPKGPEHQAHHNSSVHSTESIFNRAAIPRTHEFACAVYSMASTRSYFTYNFLCFLQRLFHRPVDTEEESILGLQPFYNCLSQEAKDVLMKNLPGCEKELVLRLLGQSIQLMSPSALSVIDAIESAISEDKPFTNACQTLNQLSKHVRSALLTNS